MPFTKRRQKFIKQYIFANNLNLAYEPESTYDQTFSYRNINGLPSLLYIATNVVSWALSDCLPPSIARKLNSKSITIKTTSNDS